MNSSVLYLGRLVPSKQPHLLAEIAVRLDALRPHKPWRLWIAGSGPAEATLPEAIRSNQVTHRVRMLGWQDDPIGVVHAADCVLIALARRRAASSAVGGASGRTAQRSQRHPRQPRGGGRRHRLPLPGYRSGRLCSGHRAR